MEGSSLVPENSIENAEKLKQFQGSQSIIYQEGNSQRRQKQFPNVTSEAS